MGAADGLIWDVMRGHPGPSLMDISDFSTLVDGLDHPEGVACGPNGEIYAGGEAGQIYHVEPDGSHRQIGSTGGFVLGLCLDADANVYACDPRRQGVIRVTPDGRVSTYAAGTATRPMTVPNYPVFDAVGNLYVSDSGGWHEHNGCLWRVRPGGECEVLSDRLTAFPNGLALHPDGTYLYVALSQMPGVVRVELLADGSIGEPETVVELPHNVPDGLAFDEERNLYVSCYTPAVIYRVTPAGEVAIVVSDWEATALATPTNIAFCGADHRTLVVASLSRWHLARAQMPIPGARLNYPKLG